MGKVDGLFRYNRKQCAGKFHSTNLLHVQRFVVYLSSSNVYAAPIIMNTTSMCMVSSRPISLKIVTVYLDISLANETLLSTSYVIIVNPILQCDVKYVTVVSNHARQTVLF